MSYQFEEPIRQVVVLRDQVAAIDAEVATAKAAWEEEHKQLLEVQRLAREHLKTAEETLRGITLDVYAETGDKAPYPGVGIRVSEEAVYNPNIAKQWAIDKSLPNLLALETREFEKAAKVLHPDFVVFQDKVTATISQTLGVTEKAEVTA